MVSIATLIGVVAIAVISVGIGVNTTAGREQIRLLVQQQLRGIQLSFGFSCRVRLDCDVFLERGQASLGL